MAQRKSSRKKTATPRKKTAGKKPAAGASSGDAPTYPIESVNNALKLLTLLQDRPAVGVTEAAQLLDVAPSTAHRLFQMLKFHDLVEQPSSSRTYVPGPALIHLGMSILRRFDLRTVARPSLAKLADQTDETVHLSILEGSNILVIDGIESTQAVRVGTRLGMTFPAHDSTSGRVLLAGLPRDRLEHLYPSSRIPLTRVGSPTSRAQLFKMLDQISAAGYAVRISEQADDVASMGVPIRDHTGRVCGAIGLAMPIARHDPARMTELIAAMQHASVEAGEALP